MKCTRQITDECKQREGEFEPKEWNIRQSYRVCPACHKVLCKQSKERSALRRAGQLPPKGNGKAQTATGETGSAQYLPTMERPKRTKTERDPNQLTPFTQNRIDTLVRNMISDTQCSRPSEIFDFTNDAPARTENRNIGQCPHCGRRAEISQSKTFGNLKVYVHLAAVFDGLPRTMDFCI